MNKVTLNHDFSARQKRPGQITSAPAASAALLVCRREHLRTHRRHALQIPHGDIELGTGVCDQRRVAIGFGQMDAAVLPHIRCQRRPPSITRARLQPCQLHADAGDAQGGGTVVADQPAREADQDRRKGGHGRYVTFQLAEVVVSRQMFKDILMLIARLRAPPAPA